MVGAVLAGLIGCGALAVLVLVASPLWRLPRYDRRTGLRG